MRRLPLYLIAATVLMPEHLAAMPEQRVATPAPLVAMRAGAVAALAPLATPAEAPAADRLGALEAKIEQLRREYESRIAQLEQEIASLKALSTAVPPAPPTPPAPPAQGWSPAQPITVVGGGKNYLNLSFDTLVAGGTSTTRDVARIETGGHDPTQRGFTVQNVETVLEGAIDPYFRGQGNIVLQIDSAGETHIELEEAYLTTTALAHNLQAKAGMFFSEFGRLNPQHPHSWDFIDQPLVNGRFLGPDGLRNPGARLSWLLPTRFYSELFMSVQDSQGGTAASFRNVPGETVFGRPVQERPLRSGADLLYVPRWSASFDPSATQTLLLGASAAIGPNGTGQQTSTRIYGLDLFWKWKPVNSQAGFPFVKWQTEAMARRYEAGAFAADTDGDGSVDLSLQPGTLRDRGAYSQVLWGFRRGWIAGVRGDYVSAGDATSGASAGGAVAGLPLTDGLDPTLRRRWRFSPNLTWFPTEYSKLRLQWNHDHLENSSSEDSLWLQFEFLLGAHAAHKF